MRVIVTAAGSGAGRAIAEGFAEAGARVHICDIDPRALEQVAASTDNIRGTVADVGEPADVDRVFDEALHWLGGVDVLVNNAGIGGPSGPIESIDDNGWDRCMRVNLSGAFSTMKRAVPHMKSQRSGCIINISSGSVRTGLPNRTPYIASKAGLVALTHTAARELGPWQIRCNSILPGLLNNDRGRALVERFGAERKLDPDAAKEQFLSYVSMRTMIEPDEIAAACLFLAGHGGRHISGQALGVCGNTEWEA